ncbi:nitrilase-related carbon-nitrogen hydrolase [Pseudooceanicola sp.]|uniref:nitrilase-related carbon-nitrogen hydrolase n=1 Tax=Pseudooceanicola sp. TaxID=1914328 RepID=UPI002603BFFC|nr:nitrilase-related carbon-nitrogen hydrolase [Pseudooceanicola sp.]MDF1857030.1 hypothetical protein [Pseudooceanicola sp.]
MTTSPGPIRAAALQLGPASATIATTCDRILTLIERAAAEGVTLAVLPELALTPYFAAKVRDDLTPFASVAENTDAVARISGQAASHGMAIVIPFAEQTNKGLFNSMVFYDRAGVQQGKFRKVHIPGKVEPDPAKTLNILEKRYFSPGDLPFAPFDMGEVRAGGMICYDRRFPESYRSLTLNGADLICVGYNTPVMEGGTLKEARRASELAICGGAYSTATHAIAAGKGGVEGGTRFIGGSFICGPDGAILVRARTQGDEVVVADLDMSKQLSLRERWDFATNRQPGTYAPELTS